MGMMGGMMGSRMGSLNQQMSGNASGFQGNTDFGTTGAGMNMNNPTGQVAMKGGGMDPMGTIQNMNKDLDQNMVHQSGGMNQGGMPVNNPVGGMLGSIFRVF